MDIEATLEEIKGLDGHIERLEDDILDLKSAIKLKKGIVKAANEAIESRKGKLAEWGYDVKHLVNSIDI